MLCYLCNWKSTQTDTERDKPAHLSVVNHIHRQTKLSACYCSRWHFTSHRLTQTALLWCTFTYPDTIHAHKLHPPYNVVPNTIHLSRLTVYLLDCWDRYPLSIYCALIKRLWMRWFQKFHPTVVIQENVKPANRTVVGRSVVRTLDTRCTNPNLKNPDYRLYLSVS